MANSQLPLTIKKTQDAISQKELSVTDLVKNYLERIKNKNSELNILLTVDEKGALKKAKDKDKKIAKVGFRKVLNDEPLIGSTVVHKDLFLTKGIRTTASSKVLENYIPAYSASVVDKLDSLGVITLGKANCDAWAHGGSGENSDYGPVKNPWNKKYVPGGSSSGSAASIAANFSLFSTGTDTGGSVRQPANFCGIVGLKPTYGAVSRYGVVAMASSVDTIGHFARSVFDVEMLFNYIKGPDGLDANVTDVQLNEVPKRPFRIGIPKEYFVKGLDNEVESNIKKVIKVYEDLGYDLVEVSMPHTKYAISVYYIIMSAEVSSNLSRYDGIRYGNDRGSFGDEAKRRIMLGTYALSAGYYDAYYLKAQKVRTKIIEDFNKAFDKVDALITPVSPTPAFKLGEKATDPLQMYLADVLTVAANIVGVPGLAIPSGFTKNKLPLGFQLMGPRFSESLLFDLGKKYQGKVGFKPKDTLAL